MEDRKHEAIRDLVRVSRQGSPTARAVRGRLRAMGYTDAEIVAAVESVTADLKSRGQRPGLRRR